jgi:polyhydroxyalkanoate synthesis regulator phasin
MVETRSASHNGKVKMPDILKELAKKGKAGRKEIEARLEKVVGDAHIEQRIAELRGKLELLQKTGRERTETWRGKADSFRAEALERMVEVQGKVVSFLGVATREQVEELHLELERLAKRFESGQKARSARKGTPKREGKG